MGRYDLTHPDLSKQLPGGYLGEAREHGKLRRAAMLDESAALKACSWGLFQILGENHAEAGFATVEAFVDAMLFSRKSHLNAFAKFIAFDRRKQQAIKDHDWTTFARLYNGPDYAVRGYHTKMAAAHDHITAATAKAAKR